MSIKRCRFFGGLMGSQARWLNKMSLRGYRLVDTDRLFYEFEDCEPGEYEYCVEYIGDKSKEHADEYKHFLLDLGYDVFFKNINLNFSVGKVYYRPFAEKGGRIASASTTHNKELLIVAKKKDGVPFELHTTNEDRLRYLKRLCAPWTFTFAVFFLLGIFLENAALSIASLIFAIPVILFQRDIYILKKENDISE